jgi:hypothetical protein
VQQATAAVEARPVEGVQLTAPVIVALSATSVTEAHPAPAATETRLEATAATLQREPAAAKVRSEVVVEAQQELALGGSSQATAVEIPDDDAPPPGWDQWESLPTPAPEPQAGALVRRWDGHMVAGGSRRGQGASRQAAPLFADAQEEQQLWEELRDHGASLNRALNEALRIHGGPTWHVFQVRCCCFFL